MQLRDTFIRPVKYAYIYCSKCGNRIGQDAYSLKRHSIDCGFKTTDYISCFREDEDYVYSLNSKEEGIDLTICTPGMIPSRLHKDRFTGGKWKGIFQAHFSAATGKITTRSIRPTNGLNIWLEMIRIGKIRPLHTVSDGRILHKAFPEIFDIYDFPTFVHYFKTGKLSTRAFLTDEQALSITETLTNPGIRLSEFHDKKYLAIRLESGEGLLFSTGFSFCDQKTEVNTLLSQKIELTFTEDDILAFDQENPSFCLKNLMKSGSRAMLLSLLCSHYHPAMEQFAKSDCGFFLEEPSLFSDFWNRPAQTFKNLQDLTGLPVKILRKLEINSDYGPTLFPRLSSVFKEFPVFFEVPYLTKDMQLLLARNVSTQADPIPSEILDFEDFSRKEILRMLRYLGGMTSSAYDFYRDYLNLTNQNGERPDGLTPGNLTDAHNLATRVKLDLSFSKKVREGFKEWVTSENYQRLTTPLYSDPMDPDNPDPFKNNSYVILAPGSPFDLSAESAAMHNCVRTYIQRVSERKTKIYFLRRKSAPDQSLCTIEVYGDRIWQVKAFANKPASLEIQHFVRRWAYVNGLKTGYTPDLFASRNY